MTVKELITELQKYPDDMLVVSADSGEMHGTYANASLMQVLYSEQDHSCYDDDNKIKGDLRKALCIDAVVE